MHSKEVNDIEKDLIEEVAMILNQEAKQISADDLLHDLGLDSLGFVELLVSIERIFNIKLMNTHLSKEDFSTISSLSKRIYETINE